MAGDGSDRKRLQDEGASGEGVSTKRTKLLVASLQETENKGTVQSDTENINYLRLMELDDTDLVSNSEQFSCPVCLMDQSVGVGIVLKDCLHTFCRPCLVKTIEVNVDADVICPYRDGTYACESVIQQTEIKALVPADLFQMHLSRSLSQAEKQTGNSFHCRTPDCQGWGIIEGNVSTFSCPSCKHESCIPCKTIHEGENCTIYRAKQNAENDSTSRRLLEGMVEKREAMICPYCGVVVQKISGCNNMSCSMCRRAFRWTGKNC